MSFPRYNAYRNSSVDWLGEVPRHWVMRPLWTLFRRTKRTGHASELLLSVYRDFGVVLKSSRDDNFNKASDDLDLYQLVEAGDLAINKMKAWQGSVGISELRGIVSPAYFVYNSIHSENSRYLHYLLRSPQYTAAYLSISKGIRVNQWDMDPQYHSRLPVLTPPLMEQIAIIGFLDRETAKIDALAEEQQRLIALLKEKRQAVISHAVTKGLDPNAPMKDSGVEWLGEVPAHWDLMPLKRDLEFLTSGSRGWAEHYAEDGELFIRIGNLTRETTALDLSDIQRVKVPEGSEGERTKVRPGDLLFSITAYLGSVAIAPSDIETAYVSQHVALARLRQRRFLPDWVGLVTLSSIGKTYLETQGYGGTKIQLSLDDVANLPMTAPPIDEQADIVAFLEGEASKFEGLVAESKAAIDLLQERRSALISAAVTGKIDVRALAPAAAEAA
jgi:type I restriction enzyme, S subunit